MKSHGKSKAVIAAVIFEVNSLQSSRFGEPCRFLRETAPRIVGKAGQIPGFSGFLAEIVIQFPESFRKEGAFIARCLSQLHIGGKLAVLQKLADTLGGTLPGNDLGGLVVATAPRCAGGGWTSPCSRGFSQCEIPP